jgi:hypothetical protein
MGKILNMAERCRTGRTGLRAPTALLAAGVVAVLLGSSVTVAQAAPVRPRLAAAVAGDLAAISCDSTSNCMAVGNRSSTSKQPLETLAEKWNGTAWSVVPSPNPAGSNGSLLAGVACTSTKNCLAVGNYFDSSAQSTRPIAERWNGTTWSLATVPAPSGSTDAYLDAVYCTSATNCWASGGSMNDTLIERWNGTTWAIVSSPSPTPGKPNILTGLACGSSSKCWSVGYTFPTKNSGSLTEKWNGSTWSLVSTPSSKNGQLIGDSCAGTSACLAVGIGNNLLVIAQRWNGTAWTAAPPKSPAGATSSELNAVSCTGGSACVSVGNYTTSSVSPTLAEGWNGTAWALQAMPPISGSSYASLAGVSCAKTASCWAAGVTITPSGASSPLLEKWNGTAWSVAG